MKAANTLEYLEVYFAVQNFNCIPAIFSTFYIKKNANNKYSQQIEDLIIKLPSNFVKLFYKADPSIY